VDQIQDMNLCQRRTLDVFEAQTWLRADILSVMSLQQLLSTAIVYISDSLNIPVYPPKAWISENGI
jgi:hypothetical protein